MSVLLVLVPTNHIPAQELEETADKINQDRRRKQYSRDTAGVTHYAGEKRLVLADREALTYLAQDKRWEGAEIKSVFLNTRNIFDNRPLVR